MNSLKTRLLDVFKEKMNMKYKGGIYHLTQIKLCYNSNQIEGSCLTEDQTRYIFETNMVSSIDGEAVIIDDIVETVSHFKCFNQIIKTSDTELDEETIKNYHKMLKRRICNE